jgi:short-subunit dehydrogenase
LVTGASSGIGVEIARELASRGWAIALAARRVDKMEEVARELREKWGGPTHIFSSDLSTIDGPRRLVEDVERSGLAIDVLVNNAGFGWRGAFIESDVDRMLEMVRLNVAAVTELTCRVLPGMVERAKREMSGASARTADGPARGILNIASTAAFAPGPFMTVYYASKAYVESFSVAIREELRGTGVHCTCLCPGPVKTEFSAVAGSDNSSLFKRATRVDAAGVARAGVDGLVRNRAVVIPGIGNRVVTMGARMLTRARAASVARGLQEPA